MIDATIKRVETSYNDLSAVNEQSLEATGCACKSRSRWSFC